MRTSAPVEGGKIHLPTSTVPSRKQVVVVTIRWLGRSTHAVRDALQIAPRDDSRENLHDRAHGVFRSRKRAEIRTQIAEFVG
jgi:hypothetical protein